MKTIKKLLAKSDNNFYTFAPEFNNIIENKVSDYDNMNGEEKASLRGFLEDMQKGGCISGMIGEFIYHNDCKAFYIKHIDDLEEFKTELEEQMGEPIANRHNLPHYTFVVWLCFEEYCYNLYSQIFEQ